MNSHICVAQDSELDSDFSECLFCLTRGHAQNATRIFLGDLRSHLCTKDSPAAECGQKSLETVTAEPNITWHALRRREVAGDEDGITIANGYTL